MVTSRLAFKGVIECKQAYNIIIQISESGKWVITEKPYNTKYEYSIAMRREKTSLAY